jgi:hypothetical protein
MGADLYIEKIHQTRTKKYEPHYDEAIRRRNALPPKSMAYRQAHAQVIKYYDLIYSEGYFRDSYNATNVLNRLGLSWWADVLPMCTEDQKLEGGKLRHFRDRVAAATLTLPTKEELEKHHGTLEDQGENSLAGWHDYFIQKHAELLAFLNEAIALDSAVQCSL